MNIVKFMTTDLFGKLIMHKNRPYQDLCGLFITLFHTGDTT